MELFGYEKRIDNVFALLGNHENDITKSIAFIFSISNSFLKLFLSTVLPECINYSFNDTKILFQQNHNSGITDIEIYQANLFHVVIEAKVMYNRPSLIQLQKYADYLNESNCSYRKIVTLSDLSSSTALFNFPTSLSNIDITHVSYSEIIILAQKSISSSKNKEKFLIRGFIDFLSEVTNMRNAHSNSVYVVPISGSSIKKHDVDRIYSCPVGNRFLNEPTNYLGFRHHGKLQYINHVEEVDYVDNGGVLYFIFKLGPDIVPAHDVITGGKYRGTKYYCDIDLLLTSNSIIEAYKKTKQRHSN